MDFHDPQGLPNREACPTGEAWPGEPRKALRGQQDWRAAGNCDGVFVVG